MFRSTKITNSGFLTSLMVAICIADSFAFQSAARDLISVPVETITDRIRGGLLGQILGNLNGLPYEFTYTDEPGDIKNYIPSLPNGAWTDDDTDFEWVYIMEMQKKRKTLLSYPEISFLWKERINKSIWSSNRYARHLMDLNIDPPLTGNTGINPWAEFNVSGQFLSETFGLIAPGMPQTASKIGLNYTRVAISAEPAQTTQLFTTMIATAFFEKDVDKILEAGIASLDPESNTLKIVRDVQNWHSQYPADWKMSRKSLKDKYLLEDGRTRDRNGTELNTGAILIAFLYGKGDFAETLKLSFNLGWDADCNAATLGTILGVTYGYRKMISDQPVGDTGTKKIEGWQIVDRYRNTTRDNMPMDETITSFADRIIELFELANSENGGNKTVIDQQLVYQIPREKPAPVVWVSTPEEERMEILKAHKMDIIKDLQSGNRTEMARAAYLAVNLGMSEQLEAEYPNHWKDAKYALSGYWKIMNNIFFGDFKALNDLKEVFVRAGFERPSRKYTDSELYNDPIFWKDPELLYQDL